MLTTTSSPHSLTIPIITIVDLPQHWVVLAPSLNFCKANWQEFILDLVVRVADMAESPPLGTSEEIQAAAGARQRCLLSPSSHQLGGVIGAGAAGLCISSAPL